MRYTRYNYKKKKNNDLLKLILSFVGTSIFVIIVGVLLANVIVHFLPLNNAGTTDDGNKNEVSQANNLEEANNKVSNDGESIPVNAEVNKKNQESENAQGNINTSFTAIQCGYFAQEGNAKDYFNKISNEYGAFIYNDADKFKVLAGIYKGDEGQATIDRLTSSGIECAKVEFDLNGINAIESQVAGIYDGYLDILNNAFKDDVKSVDTTDFKTWVGKLDDIKEGDKKEVLSDLKKHINELGSEIVKGDVSNEIQYLYKVLLNFKK